MGFKDKSPAAAPSDKEKDKESAAKQLTMMSEIIREMRYLIIANVNENRGFTEEELGNVRTYVKNIAEATNPESSLNEQNLKKLDGGESAAAAAIGEYYYMWLWIPNRRSMQAIDVRSCISKALSSGSAHVHLVGSPKS